MIKAYRFVKEYYNEKTARIKRDVTLTTQQKQEICNHLDYIYTGMTRGTIMLDEGMREIAKEYR